jgi:hypothetical protein
MATFMEEQDAYLIGGIKYHSRFPREWAENHLEGTGPENCGNCLCHGSLAGVFIGYCGNCADYVYEGDRGQGLMKEGIEFNSRGQSIYETYLYGLTFNIDATRLVPEDDPAAMTESNYWIYRCKILGELNTCPTDSEECDTPSDCESDTGDNSDMDISIMNCHFDGGYNDM